VTSFRERGKVRRSGHELFVADRASGIVPFLSLRKWTKKTAPPTGYDESHRLLECLMQGVIKKSVLQSGIVL
jgi:hypothetical protein